MACPVSFLSRILGYFRCRAATCCGRGRDIPLRGLFQLAQAAVQIGEPLRDDVRQILLIQIVGGVHRLVVDAHHLGRVRPRRCSWRAGCLQHHAARADAGVVADDTPDPAPWRPRRPCTLLPRVGWRLPVSLPVPPSVTPVVDGAVVADLRRSRRSRCPCRGRSHRPLPILAPGWISMPVLVPATLADPAGEEKVLVLVQPVAQCGGTPECGSPGTAA